MHGCATEVLSIVIDMTSLPVQDVISTVTAKEFVRKINGMDRLNRENAALDAILDGEFPAYMKEFVDIMLVFADSTGTGRKLTIRVLPDYLMIGTHDDHLRMPLMPITAQKIADEWNCIMPTPHMTTLIWSAAQKLPPQPWGPPYDASMMSTDRFIKHNERIELSILKGKLDSTKLIGGHKKDVVITKQLVNQYYKKRVAIFGWHQSDGKPIQPLYLGHEDTYADYAHGIRLVSKECLLDDQPDDLTRVLADPNVCMAVSTEGPLTRTSYFPT